MLTLNPDTITSFPGARIVFSVIHNGNPLSLSSYSGATVEIFFPGQNPYLATIHESNNTFSWIVPISEGTHEVRVLVSWADTAEYAEFSITINPVMASRFTLETSINPTGLVYADIYNPLGQLVHSSQMSQDGFNYSTSHTPGNDWIEGEYRAAIRDDNGINQVMSIWIERPDLASMAMFFGLPSWQRQVLEYLKYEMMGDTDPLHPGCLFTLEEYAKHWSSVVGEVNDTIPTTTYHPVAIPTAWANVMLKGTLLRVYHALANRSVTIPRWTNISAPMQDESHYQGAWEQRYNSLKPEYDQDKAIMKGHHHLPGPAITVDPFLGWIGGNLAGQSGLALIGKPSWFSRTWGYR